jgi:hypothetical protein
MIKQFDRATARLVGQRIEKELAKLGSELGLKISYSGGTYSPTNYTCKVKCVVLDADGSTVAAEKAVFAQYASLMGLKPEDYGREFTQRGRTFVISGIAPRRRKNPVMARDKKSGRTYLFQPEIVTLLLKG